MSFPCIIIHGDDPSDLFLLNKNSRPAWNPWHNFITLHNKYLYAENCRVRAVLHEITPGNLYLSLLLILRQFSLPSSFFFTTSRKLKGNPNTLMKTDKAFHFITSFNDCDLLFLSPIPLFSRQRTPYCLFSFCTENAVTKNQNTFVGKKGECVSIILVCKKCRE